MAKWKCEPCGHVSEEKSGEVCLVCKSPTSAVVEIKSEKGKVKIKKH